MNVKRVKIITTAPHKDADKIRHALGEAGAGSIGDYRYCSFSITGKGRFMPKEKSLRLEIWQRREDDYIRNFKPQEKADIVIDGTQPFEKQVKAS